MQSVMGKLSPESFLNNQNWAYLWIKSVKFHAVFFIACQVESCQNILKLSCRSLVIDSNFSFNKHINNLCKKASTKFNALTRISGYMDLPKRRMIMKLFKTSSFGYCPLIGCFIVEHEKIKISSIHEGKLNVSIQYGFRTFKWNFPEQGFTVQFKEKLNIFLLHKYTQYIIVLNHYPFLIYRYKN